MGLIIPSGQQVKLCNSRGQPIPSNGVKLYTTSDIAPQISSEFGDLISGGGNDALTLISSTFSGANFSGQFKQMGMQIWKKSSPIELTLDIELNMTYSGKTEVTDVIKEILQQIVPTVSGNSLIPPGPNIITILEGSGIEIAQTVATKIKDSGIARGDNRWFKLSIGKFFNLHQVIVTKATPIYKMGTLDDQDYPISAGLSLDVRTVDVVNADMISMLETAVTTDPTQSIDASNSLINS